MAATRFYGCTVLAGLDARRRGAHGFIRAYDAEHSGRFGWFAVCRRCRGAADSSAFVSETLCMFELEISEDRVDWPERTVFRRFADCGAGGRWAMTFRQTMPASSRKQFRQRGRLLLPR